MPELKDLREVADSSTQAVLLSHKDMGTAHKQINIQNIFIHTFLSCLFIYTWCDVQFLNIQNQNKYIKYYMNNVVL